MREKLLTRGPDALADYELLELLLYFAMPKGDTKPLAPAASAGCWRRRASYSARVASGRTRSALKLVQASALRMQQAEVMGTPVLNNWGRLMAYLNSAMARELTVWIGMEQGPC